MDKWLKKSTSVDSDKQVSKARKQVSTVVDCPLCSKSFLSSVVELHAADCRGIVEQSQQAIEADKYSNKETSKDAKRSRSPEEEESPTQKLKKPRSAFQVLTASAAVKPRKERFICSEELHVQWSAQGEAGSEWNQPESPPWSARMELYKDVDLVGVRKQLFKTSRILLDSGLSSEKDESFTDAVATAACSSPQFCDVFSPHASRWRSGRTATQLSVGVLKSVLQKSVRRGLGAASLFCAAELLVKDRMEFFRRMPIIVVEDSILHQHTDFLVWLMLACHKGFVPGVPHLRKCFAIVLQVAMSKKADTCGSGAETIEPIHVGLLEKQIVELQENLTPKCVTLVRALTCRAYFGGMGGDKRMLLRFAQKWLHRFASAARLERSEDQKSEENPWVLALDKHHRECCQAVMAGSIDLPVAGIDFHCCPWVLEQVEAPTVHQDALRSAMWFFHSSINVRTYLTREDFEGLREESACVADDAAAQQVTQDRLKQQFMLQSVWRQVEAKVIQICTTFLESKCQGAGNVTIV